jgi:hypothetical protein
LNRNAKSTLFAYFLLPDKTFCACPREQMVSSLMDSFLLSLRTQRIRDQHEGIE